MVSQEQAQVIAEMINLGPVSLFPKGIPGVFEIKKAQEVTEAGKQGVRLEVILSLHTQPPLEAVIDVYQAFSFSGGLTPTLDKKWRRWIRPESWTEAEITTVEGKQTWLLGHKGASGVAGVAAFTPGQPAS